MCGLDSRLVSARILPLSAGGLESVGSSPRNPQIVHFADYILDLETAELRRNGTRIVLQAQPFEILKTLIESEGQLVTRDELIKRLWPSGTFVDFDQSLNRAVGRLREALGDDAEHPLFIETLPRKGYRFIAPVRGLAAPFPEIADRGLAAKRKLKVWLGVAALLIASAAVVGVLPYWLAGRVEAFEKIEITRLTNIGTVLIAAISPDGRYVAYATAESPGLLETSFVSQESLWLRQVGTGTDIQIVPLAAVHYQGLTFSREADFLYVTESNPNDRSLGVLYKMPAVGGSRKRLVDNVAIEYGFFVNPVTLSPNGKLVAFFRDAPSKLQTTLMIANEDGSGERELAVRNWPDGFGGMVAWSPDGRTIATAVNNSQAGTKNTSLVEVPVQGGVLRVLAQNRWVWVPDLAWLPNGRGLIATTQERNFGPEQLVYISYPNGDVRRISDDPNYYHTVSVTADARVVAMTQFEFSINAWVASVAELDDAKPITSHGRGDDPTWSPDGRIVHWSYEDGNIWLIGADGSNPKQLTSGTGASNFDPRVTPNGHYIVFVSDRGGTMQIWRMDSDGNNLKPLTNGPLQAVDPDYSPDGKWVVFVKGGAEKGVWRVPIEGGDPVRLNDEEAAHPTVSPDGKIIAYICRNPSRDPLDDFESSTRGVALMAFEGGPSIRHFDISHLTAFRWGPDGHSLLYTKNERGVDNFWSQSLVGGKPKQITHFNDQEIRAFDLSRDGKRVVMSRGTSRQDVVLVHNLR